MLYTRGATYLCRTRDECPRTHYTKTSGGFAIDRKGHPLICSIGAGCKSQLRILRAAAAHYPMLRKFLHDVHTAIRSHVLSMTLIKLCALLLIIVGMYVYMESITNLKTSIGTRQLVYQMRACAQLANFACGRPRFYCSCL